MFLCLAACSAEVRAVDGDGGAAGSGLAPAAGGSGSAVDLPMVPPGQVLARLVCEEDYPWLILEILPFVEEECVVPPELDSATVLNIAVYGWDFTATTFGMFESPHGHVSAVWSDGQAVDVTFTIEPFSGTPAMVSWQLDALDPKYGGSGRTDISLCAAFEGLECTPP